MSKPSRGDAIGIESVADQVSPGRAGHINRGTSQGFETVPFGTTIAGSGNYESAPDTSSGASGGFEQAADPLVFQGYMQIGRPDADVGVAGRVPHIARLMALAIKFQGILDTGVVKNQTELARLACVTQPRMTQIMNLNFLAPDIQEAILFLDGGAAVSEKALRPISVEESWGFQRSMWKELNDAA